MKPPIESQIVDVRGHKVILASNLADLYGVETKRLNEQVRRNIDRFPDDFCFQLTAEEAEALKLQSSLRSQIATLNGDNTQNTCRWRLRSTERLWPLRC